jgi:putative transposase
MNITVSERLVAYLMSNAGIRGLPGPAKVKRLHGIATADDSALVINARRDPLR